MSSKALINPRVCINCGKELQKDDQYCPRCGQKVDANNLSMRAVVKEFTQNYISLDNRFGRSIVPFLFRPGDLTLKFIKGKRKSYANPFRLYILSSILFFFILKSYINKDTYGDVGGQDQVMLGEFNDLNTKQAFLLDSILPNDIKEGLNKEDVPSFAKAFNELSNSEKQSLVEHLNDSIRKELGVPILNSNLSPYYKSGYSQSSNGFKFNVNDIKLDELEPYRYDKRYSHQQLYDSLKLENPSYWKKLSVMQAIKLYRAKENDFGKMIFKNLSLMMFMVVPISALLLMLFFFKRIHFYVEHLIHSIILHAFMFFSFSVLLAIDLALNQQYTSEFILTGVVIYSVYFLVSIIKVYTPKKRWLIIKMPFLLIFYASVAIICFGLEALLSFYLY